MLDRTIALTEAIINHVKQMKNDPESVDFNEYEHLNDLFEKRGEYIQRMQEAGVDVSSLERVEKAKKLMVLNDELGPLMTEIKQVLGKRMKKANMGHLAVRGYGGSRSNDGSFIDNRN